MTVQAGCGSGMPACAAVSLVVVQMQMCFLLDPAMATVLCDGPMMGRLLLGLFKWHVAPESRRSVLISCKGC